MYVSTNLRPENDAMHCLTSYSKFDVRMHMEANSIASYQFQFKNSWQYVYTILCMYKQQYLR